MEIDKASTSPSTARQLCGTISLRTYKFRDYLNRIENVFVNTCALYEILESVFVNYKMVGAGKSNISMWSSYGRFISGVVDGRRRTSRWVGLGYVLLIKQALLSGIRGPMIFLVPCLFSIFKHSLTTPLFTL